MECGVWSVECGVAVEILRISLDYKGRYFVDSLRGILSFDAEDCAKQHSKTPHSTLQTPHSNSSEFKVVPFEPSQVHGVAAGDGQAALQGIEHGKQRSGGHQQQAGACLEGAG